MMFERNDPINPNWILWGIIMGSAVGWYFGSLSEGLFAGLMFGGLLAFYGPAKRDKE